MRRSRPNLLASALENTAAATNLISFLKALPDCRLRRGIRYPQWWMLLVAILAILSNQGSLLGMERFAKRHRKTLNKLLGTHIAKPPSDSTFRLLLSQLDVDCLVSIRLMRPSNRLSPDRSEQEDIKAIAGTFF